MNINAEREALMQTSRDWAAAVARGDFDAALAFWMDDAIVLPPDLPALVGKSAIGAYVRQAAALPGFSITWEPEHAMVSDDGQMGYMIERNRVTMTNAGGSLHVQHGKAVTVWRKDAAGAWKCAVDTWNNNPREFVFPRQADHHQGP